MRLIRLKLKSRIKVLIADVAKEVGVDTGYAIDVYALLRLRGGGVPDLTRVARLAKALATAESISTTTAELMIGQRRAQLSTVASSALFAGTLTLIKSNQMTIGPALRSLLRSLNELTKKVRQAQCMTCNFLNQCDFGKQYSSRVVDITKVIDPDFQKKVHADCPARPDIVAVNGIDSALRFMAKALEDPDATKAAAKKNPAVQQLADSHEDANAAPNAEDEDPSIGDAAAGNVAAGGLSEDLDTDDDDTARDCPPTTISGQGRGGDTFTSNFKGGYVIPPEDLIKNLTTSNMVLFQLGQAFDILLASTVKGKFAPTPLPSSEKANRQMTKLSDITKVTLTSNALDDELFEAKTMKKSHTIRQEMEPKERRKIMYFLVDSSGSMATSLNNKKVLTRSELTLVLLLSLLRRLEKDKGWTFIRFFDTSVSRLLKATDATSYEDARTMISNASFNGAGTFIERALVQVATDIAAAKANAGNMEIAKSEILLITDAEDTLDEASLRASLPPDTEFNVLDVSGTAAGTARSNASAVLQKLAKKYYKASGDDLSPAKIIELI